MDLTTFNLTKNKNKQFFYSDGVTTGTNPWQKWIKPSNASLIYFIVLGGGAGGGAGKQLGNLANCSGGSGGGSTSITTGLFPAALLPNNLYLSVGKGGAGGTVGASGIAGNFSYVSFDQDTTNYNLLLQSGTTVAQPGVVGTGSAQNGGIAGTAWDETTGVNSGLGKVNTIAGQTGANTSLSVTISLTAALPVSGGTGGGSFGTTVGINVAPGSITCGGYFPNVLGGANGVNLTSDPTMNGVIGNTYLSDLMFFTGGTGGGTATATSAPFGGNGGKGSFGSGGGGGGACWYSSAANGGAGGLGGDGGNGLIMISWI